MIECQKTFDVISYLPDLRSLTISHLLLAEINLLWGPFNSHLSNANLSVAVEGLVVFERLQILILNYHFLPSGLKFPALRHLSLG